MGKTRKNKENQKNKFFSWWLQLFFIILQRVTLPSIMTMTSYQAYLPSDFNSNVKLLHRKRLMNKIYGIILLLLIPCMTYAQAVRLNYGEK